MRLLKRVGEALLWMYAVAMLALIAAVGWSQRHGPEVWNPTSGPWEKQPREAWLPNGPPIPDAWYVHWKMAPKRLR
jgi:hypothetical protein